MKEGRRKFALAAFAIAAACLITGGCSAQTTNAPGANQAPASNEIQKSGALGAADADARLAAADAELAARLRAVAERAGAGAAGVSVTHVESGRTVSFEGAREFPLYSVFKLPLAVAVLRDVEEGRLKLDQKVTVKPSEVVRGTRANTELWSKEVEPTVQELLEFSLVRSDNTSSDKMLELVGGPAAVTARMRAFGLRDINVQSTVRDFLSRRGAHNTGTADDLARLLARLQKGDVLQSAHLSLLLGFMERSTTGLRRLRGDLPAGTRVADKSGTGGANEATNDVGLITLPEGRGHLAMAVLVAGSKLSFDEQERLIAELARAAYDSHAARPPATAGR